ncbi:fibronectin type III domain-containing protein [Desulfoluna spongiiphila]|uniref:fibronectin type III domain-containing protein n=1 Tax=Desulfoluna spongiiphila TaxID=419481 RepID=UPI00125409C5|nr:fibronectin type III domain-containing protein [Desulfoluna spongiiphila]VVS93159.1 fibronectin type iii [Desulfoluna spongiiphila]
MKPHRLVSPVFFVVLLCLPVVALALPDVPDDPTLAATNNTITVSWKTVADADGYTVFWGETETEVTNETNPLKRTNSELGLTDPVDADVDVSFTIGAASGVTLEPETTYYVAISAFESDRDSALSGIESVTTDADPEVPSTPANLTLDLRTDASITISWDKAAGSDNVTAYAVSVEKRVAGVFQSVSLTPDSPIDVNDPKATFSGLDADTRYRFRVTATNAQGNSDPSTWLVVDTFAAGQTRDNLAPDTPILSQDDHPPELLENLSVRVLFDGNNDGMADLSVYRVYYGTDPAALVSQQDVAPEDDAVISGLTEDTHYTFRVSAIDTSTNEAPQSDGSVSIFVEEVHALLDDPETFEGGCFVDASQGRASPRPLAAIALTLCLAVLGFAVRPRAVALLLAVLMLLLPVTGHPQDPNTIGIKAGFHRLTDDRYRDIYGENAISGTLFYQRKFQGPLAASLEAGYVKRTGTKRTDSGQESKAETELILVPLTASLTWETTVTPEVILFAGGGLDYWYYRETSDTHKVDAWDDGDYGVAGYHGRAGIKLFTRDPYFDNKAGVIFETVYSVIDRFGDNAIDLGGWTFNAGVFHTF